MAADRLIWCSNQSDISSQYVLNPDAPLYDDALREMGTMGRAVLLVHLEQNARRIRQFVHRLECSEESCRHA